MAEPVRYEKSRTAKATLGEAEAIARTAALAAAMPARVGAKWALVASGCACVVAVVALIVAVMT